LERLVDDYDERRMKSRPEVLDPLALLQHLMEEGDLKQVDLVDCFGSQSVVSAVMAGKRRINSEHARRGSAGIASPSRRRTISWARGRILASHQR